ncbi:MAG: phage tail assembly protein [Pelagimonas sp.]|jgi:hypothetical protein|nr:phage tail assembly protein [Pelagimonas sp.]
MSEIERQKEFKLGFPIEYKGEPIDTLTLRRPKMSDVKKLSASKKDALTASSETVASLAGKPVELIDELDPEDYAPMQMWTQEVLGKLSPE